MTTQQTHTPVKWFVVPCDCEGILHWEIHTDSQDNKGPVMVVSRDRASADLAAAAPELLEVCKGAMGYLAALPLAYRPDDHWLKPLSEAIAKAGG